MRAQTPNPAATPEPRNDWLVRHEGFDALAKKGDVDLLFVGDSITDGWNGNGKALWAERFKPRRAANFGRSGDRTEHVLWRLQNGNLDGIRPKVLVLLVGMKNLPKNTAAETAERVAAIVLEIRARLPESKVLVLGVFPRGTDPAKEWSARKPIAEIADA